MKKATEQVEKHSKEIDGLRAVAVIAVIINHFNPTILPSGYLGVDVFFVISGFVITNSIIKREVTDRQQFFVDFYKRRVKRLLPALLFCVAVTSVFISLFSRNSTDYVLTGLYSVPGFANIKLFLNSVDYWGESAHYNPFTHTWSLGVEEQFYFIFPLLIWLVLRKKYEKEQVRKVGVLLLVLGGLSLAGFVSFYKSSHAMVYFLMPFRFWEISLGCMLYIGLRNGLNTRINYFLKKMPLMAVALLMLAAFFLPQESGRVSTVVLVLLSLLFIAKVKTGQHTASPTAKIFRSSLFTYLGDISYSLYLWHWAIIVIARWTVGTSPVTVVLQVVLLLLASVLSYHVIEQPLRRLSWGSSLLPKLMLIPLALLMLLFAFPKTGKYLSFRLYRGAPLKASKYENTKKIMRKYDGLQPGFSKIRVIGNSHSAHILPVLRTVSRKFETELLHETDENYILIPNGDKADIAKVDEVLAPLDKGDLLILSNRNRYLYEIPYLNSRGDKWIDHSEEKQSKGYGLKTWLEELDILLDKAEQKGVKVLLFYPNIEFDSKVLKGDYCTPQWFRTVSEECKTEVPKAFLDSRFPEEFYSETKKRAQQHSHFFIFDPLPVYFKGGQTCTNEPDGVKLLKDTNHLSRVGALIMLEPFVDFLAEKEIL